MKQSKRRHRIAVPPQARELSQQREFSDRTLRMLRWNWKHKIRLPTYE